MKIAFVLPYRGSSGGVRTTKIIANGLLARNHEVRIFFRRESLRRGVRFILDKLQGAPDWLGEFRGEVRAFRDVGDCRFGEGEMVVAVGMSMSYEISHLPAGSQPIVQSVRGATPWDPDLMRKALGLPFPKILLASYLKEIVSGYGGGRVLAVVHNGIDPAEYFNSVPGSARNGVGTIYSSHPAKDPGTVLEVLQRLSTSRPSLPLRSFGGDRRPALLASCAYSRYPSVRRAREIYSRSLVWLMGSRSEGFSGPVLEAMACGCAVVATDCGGPKDIITDGVNGFLVPVGDASALLERVEYLLDNVAARERIRAAGLQTAAQFTWDKCIEKFDNALHLAMEEHACRSYTLPGEH